MSIVQQFDFEAEGQRLAGRLYLPMGTPRGAAILTGPLTSVKEQAPARWAAALAARGIAGLTFDHRHFGESEGAPRQLENPAAKAADIAAAARALAAHERTKSLPLFAVGICAGGGYMAAAVANGLPVRAFAGIAGVYPEATAQSVAKSEAELARARRAEKRWRDTGEAETIPAVGPDNGDVAMPLGEAYAYYGTPRGAVPNYVNGFAVQSRLYTIPFDVHRIAPSINVPTLIIHSDNALAPDWARRFAARLALGDVLWTRSQGQIDFYDDETLIEPLADRVAAFFREAGQEPRAAFGDRHQRGIDER